MLADKRQSVVVVAYLRLRASALLPFFSAFSVSARITVHSCALCLAQDRFKKASYTFMVAELFA